MMITDFAEKKITKKKKKKIRPGEWRPSSFTFPRPFIHNNKRIKQKNAETTEEESFSLIAAGVQSTKS